MKKIIASIILSLSLVPVYSVVPAEAGCVKTIQNRVYDSRGKLTGFSYQRVYSSDCSFYGNKSSKAIRSNRGGSR